MLRRGAGWHGLYACLRLVRLLVLPFLDFYNRIIWFIPFYFNMLASNLTWQIPASAESVGELSTDHLNLKTIKGVAYALYKPGKPPRAESSPLRAWRFLNWRYFDI